MADEISNKRRRATEMPPPAPRRHHAPAAACGAHAGAGPPCSAPPVAPASPPRPGTAAAATSPAAPAPAAPLGIWQGPLLHGRGPHAAELATLAIQLPAGYLDQMPPALQATRIAPRRGVPLGRHVVCRCALLGATSQRQAAALASMAAAALVAVVPLRRRELVMVPYLDGQARVRMVAFLRVLGD